MLDRGEQLGWFGSPEIVAELIISIVGFYYFFAHSLTTNEPFVRFAIFRDRNFLIGCFFMVIMGLMLFSSMALSTPFIQNVLGYPIITAGWVLASRGVGTLVGMLMIGRLLRLFEARYLILIGLTLTAATLYQMTGFTAEHVEPRDRHHAGWSRASAWASCSSRSARSRSSRCRRICAPTAPRCSRWCATSRARSASRW